MVRLQSLEHFVLNHMVKTMEKWVRPVWNNNNVIFQNLIKSPAKTPSNSLHIPPPPLFRNEKGTGAEMGRAIVSGIVTGDVPVSYWPIFFPFPRKLLGPVFSLLKQRTTVRVWNFGSSFILVLWDRLSSFRSWRQRARKDTDFKLTTSFIEFQLYSMQYLVVYNPWSPNKVYHLIFR